jgi:hypothetical protein
MPAITIDGDPSSTSMPVICELVKLQFLGAQVFPLSSLLYTPPMELGKTPVTGTR